MKTSPPFFFFSFIFLATYSGFASVQNNTTLHYDTLRHNRSPFFLLHSSPRTEEARPISKTIGKRIVEEIRKLTVEQQRILCQDIRQKGMRVFLYSQESNMILPSINDTRECSSAECMILSESFKLDEVQSQASCNSLISWTLTIEEPEEERERCEDSLEQKANT